MTFAQLKNRQLSFADNDACFTEPSTVLKT